MTNPYEYDPSTFTVEDALEMAYDYASQVKDAIQQKEIFKELYHKEIEKNKRYKEAWKILNLIENDESPIPFRIRELLKWFRFHDDLKNTRGWHECWDIVTPKIFEAFQVLEESKT